MILDFKGWSAVANHLRAILDDRLIELNHGQAASLRELSKRLPNNGVIIADEVGMGKTRIAAAVARSVIEAGGRVAILVPPGLGYQWNDELRKAKVDAPPILRSLWQFLQAWETDDKCSPWFCRPALVVSHAFTNWRLGERAEPWRWALLPEVYARGRKHAKGRWPRDYRENAVLDDDWVRQAAESIVTAIFDYPTSHPTRKILDELAERTPWPGALSAAEYERNAQLRPWLERAVGLGLGVFDLIIVDEAHKSRGQDSGLTRLHNHVVLHSADARCLAVTATPVELDATQWTQMLSRIWIDEKSISAATTAIAYYAQAVAKVRQCPTDKDTRDRYKDSAKAFTKELHPYLLRRDKREDPAVIRFQKVTGEDYHAYRRELEILIDTVQLSSEWKHAVCAAEALSFVSRQADQSAAKRLRLTLGNGHGIAALLDQVLRDDKADQKQIEDDQIQSNSSRSISTSAEQSTDTKRRLRVEWWQNVMSQPFKSPASALFDHPAILAALKEIETICTGGEKVLVFGRFTRPLRALVQLLNAREMLRCVDEDRVWPQSRVHDNDSWDAIVAAHQQLKRRVSLDRATLDTSLAVKYQELESQRRRVRSKLLNDIANGFEMIGPDNRVRALFEVFKSTTRGDADIVQRDDDDTLAIVARALLEMIGADIENADPIDFARAFIDLVAAASDHDEGDADGNGKLDKTEAPALWSKLMGRLREEYTRPEGGYARLMFGDTEPATRRFLQLSFNRKQGHPKVLVAQSLVGREGLNLHKACRTVVLLHPEWNPGVVEQQIGRVDRIGSLWEEKLGQALTEKGAHGELPRIEVRPVVFRGTYDEKNWQVLNERWDELRAQLHGVVISRRIADKYSDTKDIIAEINNAAPRFSPSGSVGACNED